ncbi:hypothetical protein OW763_01385 [Clostridium aestuarii]|uniref:Lipoprotein n=1 Tax=Clostridium aestuarii TaxID=338193 RepID=A0ABT4CY22_9CLOT|nr:hypothetical protein [Clostridium aestuarii]MCY6483005.1 hypothetical protein [Clostridium aestuarii]
MKKLINLILCLMIVLSVAGCSQKNISQKTTDIKGQDVKKETKLEKNTENEEDTLLIKGKIVGYAGGNDSGNTNTIVLDKKLSIDGREIDRVWLKNDVITECIPRKYMGYYLEGGKALKEEFIEKIPIEVKVDPNSFEFVDFYTFAKATKVVSLDGEANPRDKSKDEYPIDYYKEVFYALTSPDNVNYEYSFTVNIKDYYLYKNADVGDEFKIAVDKILEGGLYINMLEGSYEIDTEKKYSEEGVGK